MADLSGKVAIVSGGATLIGLETARALSAAGASVMLADINAADGEAAAAELGPTVSFTATDITDDAALDACVAATVAAFGGVDILVNIACTYLDNGIASTREEWMTALNTNVVSSALLTARVAPRMVERGGGAIVNFASISGKRAQPGRMLYAVSKAAILGMTRNQALLLEGTGIRVNSLSPGWTWSNVIRDFSGNDRAKADGVAGAFHINGRLVDATEVADTVVFLCSDAASGINGTDVAVDGGYAAIGPEQKTDQVSALAD